MNEQKTRVIILTDISSLEEGFKEPDDTQSLVRYLLYANEFDTEGIIATYTSHWDGEVKPEYIRAIIHEYGKVRDQLATHDPHFPKEEELLSKVKIGNHLDGPEYVGEGHDTEGSDWIVSVLEKNDPRPVWILVWGGTTDLAQALWRLEQRNSKEDFSSILAKAHIYCIDDQYAMGSWLRDRYPDLFYITNYKAFRGMYKGGDSSLTTSEWLKEHVVTNHGPLGAAYPIYNGGDVYTKVVRGIKEGDTPTFLYCIPNGLSELTEPSWGNWGGRFVTRSEGSPRHYFDATEEVSDDHEHGATWATVYRWRKAYQASFQARMDWCVKTPEEANHEPVAVFDGALGQTIQSGERVKLSAAGSSDPDGDALSYDWFFYREPSSYKGELTIENSDGEQASFIAPEVDSAQTIHIILTVTDDGEPPLSSYKRIVITVEP